MSDNLYERKEALLARLDNLEGCEDNPVYAGEIAEIRRELAEIQLILDTEFM